MGEVEGKTDMIWTIIAIASIILFIIGAFVYSHDTIEIKKIDAPPQITPTNISGYSEVINSIRYENDTIIQNISYKSSEVKSFT